MHGERVKGLLDKFSRRFNDNVIGMSLDMAREKVEAEWVLPNIEQYIELIERKNGKRNSGTILSKLLPEGTIYRDNDRLDFSSFDTDDFLGPLESICRLYPEKLGGTFLIKTVRNLNTQETARLILQEVNSKKGSFTALQSVLEDYEGNKHPAIRIRFSRKDGWWLDLLGFDTMSDELIQKLTEIKNEIAVRGKAREEILSTFF